MEENMRRVLLVRYGEIHLKGNNRPYFERMLFQAMKDAVRGFEGARVVKAEGRYYIEDYDPAREAEVMEAMTRVFGVYSVSAAREMEKDWETIVQNAIEMMREEVERRGKCTFKVLPRRADKTYPMDSMEMGRELGGRILEAVEGVSVDVHHFEVPVGLEIRERAYLYIGETLGAGGMPVGCGGKAALLLSGGIDSPVAGHMIMKRGVAIECVHFHSFPYTSERAKDKVLELARLLSRYCGSIKVYVVHFTDVQLAIYEQCPASQTTIIMRIGMMKIAEKIAEKSGCRALITGESLGQVASQTLESLCCTDAAVSMPVFRPCIGFDKVEIMDRARAIGTYETSILPYEDCCTIFTPKHPVTRPKAEDIYNSIEKMEGWEALLEQAVEKTEAITVRP
jgi:thiamine biosynthesis protein ThiI